MRLIQLITTIFFLLSNLSAIGQEWSGRISIIEKNVIDNNTMIIVEKGEVEASVNTKEMIRFFSTDASYNLLSFSTKNRNLGLGFNGEFEEFLPNEGLVVKDFLLYSFEMYINLTRSLQVSLNVENFLNFKDSTFELEPVLWNDDRISNLTILEHATAHFINISFNYSF